MEVAHQGVDSGNIMCVHRFWSVGPGFRQSNVWTKEETPKFGAVFFSPSSEKYIFVLGKYCDCLSFKHYAAVVVAYWTDTHQVMMEIGYDISSDDREIIVQ